MSNCAKCGSAAAYWTIVNKDNNTNNYCDPCYKAHNLADYKKEMDDFHKTNQNSASTNTAQLKRNGSSTTTDTGVKIEKLKLKQYSPDQVKGLVILYNEYISSSNADAVNSAVNNLLPLPLPPIGLIRDEGVDIHNIPFCIGRLYQGMTTLIGPQVDPECIIEEVINIPGYSIKGRIYAYVVKQ